MFRLYSWSHHPSPRDPLAGKSAVICYSEHRFEVVKGEVTDLTFLSSFEVLRLGLTGSCAYEARRSADPVSTKFQLVVNLKTAKAIGLTLPERFLLRADELIE